jgi:hypothetical protein
MIHHRSLLDSTSMGEIDPKSGGGERREATEDDNNNGHRHPILLMI